MLHVERFAVRGVDGVGLKRRGALQLPDFLRDHLLP